jgi:hypothetical protein
MRRNATTLTLILTGMLSMTFLISASLVASSAQQATPVPPLSPAEMRAMDNLSEEQISAIQESCCLEHGEVWVTPGPYFPGGCVVDAFAPASQYQPIQECETLRFRAAVAPYLDATPLAGDTPTPEDTPTIEVTEGVQFTLRFEAPGYESAETTRFTQGYDPSSISVWGFVLDEQGTPIPYATVTLLELGISEISDEDGFYQLYVSTEGTRPFEENLDWTLIGSITGADVVVELPDVLPLLGDTPLVLTVTDQNGQPLKNGNVSLTLVEPDRPSFAALEQEQARLDQNGQFSTRLFLGDPLDYAYVCDTALNVVLDVVVMDQNGVNVLAQTRIERPLNLALIHGLTVGPDMQPRAETFEPDLSPYAPGQPRVAELAQELFVAHERDDQGNFCVLVRPLQPGTLRQPPANVWQLQWSVLDHLPLYFPLPQAPQPGQKVELGKIDVLTPEEHEQRLKSVLEEFIREMPLTPSARSDALNGLNNVLFEYNSTGSVPYFKDNFTSFGGSIVTPHSKQEYWGLNLVNDEDAAYVIMLHEMGHFLHHTLVERHNYLHVCYNKFATGSHETWQAPAGKGETGQMYLSFAESAGDFYAYVAYQYWEQKHPEIKESVYFQRREYLPEFEKDDKALAVLNSGTPGYKVEGVQTRFLQAYYGERTRTNAVWVYSDYLATMLLYMDVADSWVRRPARTMQQWVQTKQTRDARVTALASRYQLLANPAPVLMPTSSNLSPSARIGDKTVDFSDFPVEEVPLGVEIEVQSGTMNLDMSTNTQRRNLYLGQGTVIILHSDGLVEVKKGLVGADFSVQIKTPTAQIMPAGTMFVVEVGESGETRVQTWQGQVRVEGNAGGSQTLNAGQQVAVSSGGALGEVGAFDVEAARQELLPAPDMPFDLLALGVSDETSTSTEPETGLIGPGLIAALCCSFDLLLLLLLFTVVRKRRKTRPRRAAPRRGGAGAVLVVLQGPSTGMRIPLGASTRIGRAPDNDVVIGLPRVSSRHALISATESGHVIADQDSTNGTWVNGERIVQPQLLRPGDVIAVGGERFEYRLGATS